MLVLDRVARPIPTACSAGRPSARDRPGEIVAIIGGCGCGKSTLLRAIAGLDRADAGHGRIDGEAITAPHPKIGIIFQEPRLMPWLTRRRQRHLRPRRTCRRRARASARRARSPRSAWPTRPRPGRANCPAAGAARGDRPRAGAAAAGAAARRAVLRARCLHPARAAGPSARLWAIEPTLLLVTHDIDEALVLADRIIVMRRRPGRIYARSSRPAAPARPKSAVFENFKRHVLTALDRSLERAVGVEHPEHKAAPGAAMWW